MIKLYGREGRGRNFRVLDSLMGYRPFSKTSGNKYYVKLRRGDAIFRIY